MFENWQGINPMGLSASLAEKKTKKKKMSPAFLKSNTKIQGIDPMFLCDPWSESFIKDQDNHQNIDIKNVTFFEKININH